jgi:agmatinase
MRQHANQFLGLDPEFTSFENAAVAVLPFPYEGGISYRAGTVKAPDAVLEASRHLELYDEILDGEPFRMGITTVAPPEIPKQPEEMIKALYESSLYLMEQNKFVVVIGGDHSITSGHVKAALERHGKVSIIQLDAHADLRNTYEDSPFSHACVMSRIREMTAHTLQIGIRSMSIEEAERITPEKISLCTMHDYRSGVFDLNGALDKLPDPVFLTIDVDVFDWSVIMSTGTPEPGGFLWDEALDLLNSIFARKNVIGFDIVELTYSENDHNSPFAVAKLLYKMLGFKLSTVIAEKKLRWITEPSGPLFH